jgi:hypothetical protein
MGATSFENVTAFEVSAAYAFPDTASRLMATIADSLRQPFIPAQLLVVAGDEKSVPPAGVSAVAASRRVDKAVPVPI